MSPTNRMAIFYALHSTYFRKKSNRSSNEFFSWSVHRDLFAISTGTSTAISKPKWWWYHYLALFLLQYDITKKDWDVAVAPSSCNSFVWAKPIAFHILPYAAFMRCSMKGSICRIVWGVSRYYSYQKKTIDIDTWSSSRRHVTAAFSWREEGVGGKGPCI